MTANLPVPVVSVGGELQRVISEVEKYTDERYPLTRGAQMHLARIIEKRPELNTEARVAQLVDMLSWHSVDQMKELDELLDEHDIDHIILVLDYLYEAGVRMQVTAEEKQEARAKIKRELQFERPLETDEDIRQLVEIRAGELWQANNMETVRRIVELIVRLEEEGQSIDGTQAFNHIVRELGGLEDALSLDDEDNVEDSQSDDEDNIED